MRPMLLLIGFVAVATSARAQEVPASERAVLIELFKSADGSQWERNRNWNSDVSVCYWEGVSCTYIDFDEKRPAVAHLSLDFNKLKGTLPASLATLSHLEILNLAGNDLHGDMPESLLEKWDRHLLEFSWTGNRFSNLLTKVVIHQDPVGANCLGTSDIFFHFELSGFDANIQSVHCAQNPSTVCSVRQGIGFGIDRLSRALAGLKIRQMKPADYEYPFSVATHGTYLTTTWLWGDGATTSIKTYNRQGPIAAWTAQQLSLALLADTGWEKSSSKPKCDFER